jgi:hypothetical protein
MDCIDRGAGVTRWQMSIESRVEGWLPAHRRL